MAPSKPTPEKKGGPAKTKAAKDVIPKDGVQKTKKVPRGSKRDWSQYSHNLPRRTEVAKNGRQSGRNLIAWTRPRMAEKLLLHIEYEALLHKRPVPWDAVAHRFNPGSSGEAITQRLMRMRKELIAEGHLVPPYPQKPGGPLEDVAVRGLVRANPDRVDDAYTTRKVAWTEPIDDLKKPLGNAVYALQEPNDIDGADYEEEFDEDEDVNELDQRSFNRIRSSASDNVELSRGKGLTRPARPARSTAKNVSYAEDADDIFDGGSAAESEAEDDECDTTEHKHKGLEARNGSRPSSRTSRVHRTDRSQSRGPGDSDHDINAGFQAAFAQNPFAAAAPGPHGLGTAHMSPYGMSPNGMHWYHGSMGLPMMPFGMGMDMMSTFNTTPTRSSAFTTHATSPADFDIEGASPRSAAFFQAHLNEYNSPTPRGYADFNPMVPIPMSLVPSNAPAMSSTMPNHSMQLGSDAILGLAGEGDRGNISHDTGVQAQKPSNAEFSSFFSEAEAVAKRLKKTNERR